MVEAEIKSGTAITVKYAEKYGRIVMAVPGSIFSRYSEGTNNLIRKGCPAALCCGDVLKALEPETDGQQEEKPKRKPEKKTTEIENQKLKSPRQTAPLRPV